MSAAIPALVVAGMVAIPSGTVTPFFRDDKNAATPVDVAAFLLDDEPVTNAQFARFVRTHPSWQRSKAKPTFVDAAYLKSWRSDVDPGARNDANAPVVEVSWFAAKAYCASLKKRMPTTMEWERAFSLLDKSAATDAALAWFASPTPASLPPIEGASSSSSSSLSSSRPSAQGVHDLVGLVWEWTSDFNDVMVTDDARGNDTTLFCGSGGAKAVDPSDAATFMRWAFRSSLRAHFTTRNLGFRCAQDLR